MSYKNSHKSDSEVNRLLQLARAGDQAAAQRLLDSHRERLKKLIGLRMDKRLRARFDSSDVLQESLVKAHAQLPAYLASPTMPFYPWLRKLALWQLAEMHRHHLDRQKRAITREVAEVAEISDESVLQSIDRLVGSVTGPETRLLRKEVKQRTLEALKSLKPRDREIIELRYIEELSTEEVSAVLGISIAAVHARHFRAIQRLSQQMGDGDHG